ncbi:MAG: response regulator [Promethearchaeota archaeon]
MINIKRKKSFNILLVEDNLADIRLTEEAISKSQIISNLNVVKDGVEAINFLKKVGKYSKMTRPDLILLDLNLPKKNGLEVLKEIKQDDHLKRIPIIVLTISGAEEDLVKAYDLHANCLINKPIDVKDFYRIMKIMEEFWFRIVKLPED